MIRPKQKIFYTPGFLALALILPLGLFILHKWHAFEKRYMLEVAWYDEDSHPDAMYPFKLPPLSRTFKSVNCGPCRC